MYRQMDRHTDTHTKQGALTQLVKFLCATQALESCAGGPQAGLATHKRIIQVPRREVSELKVHNDLDTTK